MSAAATRRRKATRSEKPLCLSSYSKAVLIYAAEAQGAPFSSWPAPLRRQRQLTALVEQGWLMRRDGPERYYLTVAGHQLVHWLKNLHADKGTEAAPPIQG